MFLHVTIVCTTNRKALPTFPQQNVKKIKEEVTEKRDEK